MQVLQMIISLLGLLGLFFLMIFGLRRLSGRISAFGSERLRVVDRVVLGQGSMIMVVNVGGKLVLVGATPQKIEKIADLDAELSEYLAYSETKPETDTDDSDSTRPNFKEALGIAFRNSLGLKNK
jgi:flagellar biogenesis protein FliO